MRMMWIVERNKTRTNENKREKNYAVCIKNEINRKIQRGNYY